LAVWVIKHKYEISIIDYTKAFKYDKTVFELTKNLAFSSFFVTLIWILYYELDLIFIGKYLGAEAAAVFSVGYLFIKFLRNTTSIVFSPFQNRFNHFVGLNDLAGLKKLLVKVILFSMPVFVFTVLSIVLLSKNLVVNLAGENFLAASIILSLLALNFITTFIRTPGSIILKALVRIKEMYLLNIVTVLVFWAGVLLTVNFWGVNSIAIFKLLAGIITTLFFLKFILRFLDISIYNFLKMSVARLLIPIVIQLSFLTFINGYLPLDKGKLNLFITLATGGAGTMLAFITLYSTSFYYRSEYNNYFTKGLTRVK